MRHPRWTCAATALAVAFCCPVAQAQPRQWRLERVGSTAADIDVTSIVSLAASRSGQLYVADFGAQQIVVYDSLGRRSGTIGRKGEGPFEFTGLSHIAWLGDTLVAYDWKNLRLTFVRPDGDLLRSVRWSSPFGRPAMFFGPGGTNLYGLIYDKQTQVPMVGIAGTEVRHMEQLFVAIGSSGATTEVRRIQDSTRESAGADCWHDPKGVVEILSTSPGASGPLKAFANGGFVAASPDRSRVEWFGPTGGVARTTPSYPAIAATDAIWTREAREYLEVERRLGSLTCSPPFHRPQTLPAIRALVADDDGNVWVEITTASGIRLDVYDPFGKLTGTMPAPPRDQSDPFVVRGGRLYVIEKDNDHVRSVGIFRVRR